MWLRTQQRGSALPPAAVPLVKDVTENVMRYLATYPPFNAVHHRFLKPLPVAVRIGCDNNANESHDGKNAECISHRRSIPLNTAGPQSTPASASIFLSKTTE